MFVCVWLCVVDCGVRLVGCLFGWLVVCAFACLLCVCVFVGVPNVCVWGFVCVCVFVVVGVVVFVRVCDSVCVWLFVCVTG